VKKNKIGEYLVKLKEEGGCLVYFLRLATSLLKDEESALYYIFTRDPSGERVLKIG